VAKPDDLFLQLESEARSRAVGLEATGKLPRGFTQRHYPLSPAESYELERLKTAAAMAVDADAYVALARGEAVPPHRIIPSFFQTISRLQRGPLARKRR